MRGSDPFLLLYPQKTSNRRKEAFINRKTKVFAKYISHFYIIAVKIRCAGKRKQTRKLLKPHKPKKMNKTFTSVCKFIVAACPALIAFNNLQAHSIQQNTAAPSIVIAASGLV